MNDELWPHILQWFRVSEQQKMCLLSRGFMRRTNDYIELQLLKHIKEQKEKRHKPRSEVIKEYRFSELNAFENKEKKEPLDIEVKPRINKSNGSYPLNPIE